MCKNFGVPYEPHENGQHRTSRGDSRYYSLKSGRSLSCRYCGQSFTLRSNQAVRPIARYFLSLSLPFATCSNPSCRNYGINVFEHYARRGRPHQRHYHRVRDHTAKCRYCESAVNLGERFSLIRNNKTEERIRRTIDGSISAVRKRKTVASAQLSSEAYYKALNRAGARLGDFHAWLNARLSYPSVAVDFSETARVYTDVLTTTLRRGGKVVRYRHLRYIVSVLAYERTFYILAAHPYFLPTKFGPAPGSQFYSRATGRPSEEFSRRWDCLEHPVHNRFEGTPEEIMQSQADTSRFRQGCYIRSPYAEAAHFLVIRKMLRRFERICFYMDNAREMVPAAMVALADGIRSKQIEVVLFQRKYRKKREKPPPFAGMGAMGSQKRKEALRRHWKQTEARVQEKFREGVTSKSGKSKRISDPDRRRANALKSVTLGAFSETVNWAWLHFPAPMKREKKCRSLWLTRMPGKSFEDAELPLLFATLQPVDSAIGSIRANARAVHRPAFRAKPGRSVHKSAADPQVALSQVSVFLLARNYFQLEIDNKTIPAEELGLMIRSLRSVHYIEGLAKVALTFRLGLNEADQFSLWLRR